MAARGTKFYFVILLGLFFSISFVWAENNDGRWNNPRDYEPVIIKGENFIDFLQKPIKELYVYAYNAAANTWRPIPFQFDQKDDSSHFWLPMPNDTLDLNDELVFMAKDMGDKAPDGTIWINDLDSKNYNRVEITANDSIYGKNSWAYLYRSKNVLPLASESYVTYKSNSVNPAADTVLTQNYFEGHNKGGVPDYWILSKGNGIEILDRQKVQINMLLYGWLAITIREDLLESFFQNIKTKIGPVRLIRQVYWHIDVGMGIEPFDFSLPLKYYAYSVESGGVSGTLKTSDHVNLIRQSFDLNSNATGMKLFNPDNKNGVTIDGIGGKESVVPTLYDDPAVNWWMVTGNQGTYAIVFKMAPIGDKRSLYYNDDKKVLGEGEDTGDMMSWGDTGIKIEGKDINGKISFAYKAYYLGANKPYSLGDSLANNFKKPLQISTQPNYFVPVELSSFIANVSNGKVVLEWVTATETNNYGFDVQRKTQADQDWKKIGFAEGKGTSTAPHKYSFLDDQVAVGTYFYRLKQIDFDGSFEFSDAILIEVQPPRVFALDQNYPNPFNPETVIRYQIPSTEKLLIPVELKIYNLLGDEVRTLVEKQQGAGFYSISWDGRNNQGDPIAAGTYLYRLRAGEFTRTQKMLLLR